MRLCGAELPLAFVSGDPRRPRYVRVRCNRPSHDDGQHSWSSSDQPRLVKWLDEPNQHVIVIRKRVRAYG